MNLTEVGSWPNLRVLAWREKALYACSGYKLLQLRPEDTKASWTEVGRFNPIWWRRISSSVGLTYRLCRDGFHALATLSTGGLVAAVPRAIVTSAGEGEEFKITHRISRGTRPLNIAVTGDDSVFWGEYFDNAERAEVHIYGSRDRGETWEVVHTFPRNAVRHVHNVVYDKWADCLWILTGDYENECKVVRASCDWKQVDEVLVGNQQARAVAFVPTAGALYFASDTPLEDNFIYRLERGGKLTQLAPTNNSALYGCRVGESLFFSTMVEPSDVNTDGHARVYGSSNGTSWEMLFGWRKDSWPMLFQYGNAILPTGENATDFLALTGLAVKGCDLRTMLWRVTIDH
jgi:hypothetical protein